MRIPSIYVLAVCAAVLFGACKDRKQNNGGEPLNDNSTTLFDTEAAVKADNGKLSAKPVEGQNGKKNAVEADRGRAMELPAKMKDVQELLLKREGYYVSYNKERRVPNWVAWRLTAEHTNGNYYRSGEVFLEDTDVPRPRAADSDYYGSGYDRGHLCPSGDNKWSKKAQTQSFLFTNVCPQNHDLNKGDWNDLEIQCRYWAKRWGELFIVTGPIFYDGVRRTIGRNKVAVPDAFFKVLLYDRSKAKAIGFVYPNRSGHKDMNEYLKPVDEIERLTGIDFFPLLDDNVENAVEASSYRKMMDDWQVEKAVSYYNSRSK